MTGDRPDPLIRRSPPSPVGTREPAWPRRRRGVRTRRMLSRVRHPPPPTVLLVAYLIGQLGGALPIPGGIGAVEGGLIGTFVLYGTPPALATAAILACRVLSLSIPALLCGHALVRLRKALRAEQEMNRGIGTTG
jgi:hypothetical protein